MASVIVGTKEDAQELVNKYQREKKNVLALTFLTKNDKNSFKSDFDLLNFIFSRSLPRKSIIVNYKVEVNEFDKLMIQISAQLDAEYIVFSPNGSSFGGLEQKLDRDFVDNYEILASGLDLKLLANHVKKSKKDEYILILVPSQLETRKLIDKLKKAPEMTAVNGANVIVAHTLEDEIFSLNYRAIFVYYSVDVVDHLGLIVNFKRTLNELDIYRTLNSRSFYYIPTKVDEYKVAKLPKNRKRRYIGWEVYGIVLSFLFRSMNKNMSIQLDPVVLRVLIDLGIIDSKRNITNIGTEIYKYSESSVFAGLFYYYWQIEQNNIKYYYPGLVVTAYLEVLPEIRSTKNSITTFHDFVNFWTRMTDEIPYKVGESIKVYIAWAEKNYKGIDVNQLELFLLSLERKMKRYTVEVYGKFTAEGLIERSIPIFDRIYQMFAVKKSPETNSFLTVGNPYGLDGDIEVSTNYYPQLAKNYNVFAALRLITDDNEQSYISLVTLPLSVATAPSLRDDVPLPPLSVSVIEADTKKGPGRLLIGELPFINRVGNISLDVAGGDKEKK